MALSSTVALFLLASPAVAQDSPTPPDVRWSRSVNALALKILPADGSHLSAQLPVVATIDDGGAFRVTWNEPEVPEDGPMKLVLPRVAESGSSGWTVAVQGGVCNADASLCLPWHTEFTVPRPGAPRGRVTAERGPAPRPAVEPDAPVAHVAPHAGWHEATDEASVQAAFADADETGRPLLIDFYAVWCPPCDRLRDEFLHDPMREALLDRFVLLKADADHPASFGLKNRFEVGGYPTVLLLQADGTLLDRIVGYAGADAFAARLEGAVPASEAELIEAVVSGEGDTVENRLALSRRAEAAGDPVRAWTWLEPVLHELPGPARVHAARLALDAGAKGAEEQALAVADTLPRIGASLVSRVSDLRAARGDEAGSLALTDRWYARLAGEAWGTVEPAELGTLGQVEGRGAADHDVLAELAWHRAKWGTDPLEDLAVAALHYAAYLLLDSGLAPGEGNPWTVSLDPLLDPAFLERNEGRVHDLLSLLEGGMQYAEAERFYPPMIALHPDAFTWHYRLAGHFIKRGGYAEARVAADRALERSYGDNRLRAARRLAEVHEEMGQFAEGLAVVEEALQAPAPAESNVRTHRYRRALDTLQQRLLSRIGPR